MQITAGLIVNVANLFVTFPPSEVVVRWMKFFMMCSIALEPFANLERESREVKRRFRKFSLHMLVWREG